MSVLARALQRHTSQWDDLLLADIINELKERGGDNESVEVKSAATGCPDLAPTLAAFANMPGGGLIILGLSDPHFEPTGITNVATLEASVAAIAREAIKPPITCSFTTQSYQQAAILICRVNALPLEHRPARTGGQAYLRQSDGDYTMSNAEITQVNLLKTQAQRRTHPDRAGIPGTSRNDLDQDLLGAYLHAARTSSRRLTTESDETILRWTNVVTPEEELTLAGCYTLARYPQQFLPQLTITAAVQLPRDADGRTRSLAHLDGPLPHQLETALQWVMSNIGTTLRYDNHGNGYDSYDIPMNAVREVIANALVHRNLDSVTDSQNINIRLIGDQLTITSPGGLWGVSTDQLGMPNGRSAVNSLVYEISKKLRLTDGSRVIEGEGGGIREAKNVIAAAGLREPHFIDAGVRFTGILWAHSLFGDDDLNWLASLPETDRLSSTQRAILVKLRQGKSLSNSDIRNGFGPMDSTQVRRIMVQLTDCGYVEMTGTKGNTRYQASESLTAHDSPPTTPTQARAQGDPAPVEDLILRAAAKPLSASAISDVTGLTASQVRYRLQKLRTAGLIEAVGTSARATKYVAKAEAKR